MLLKGTELYSERNRWNLKEETIGEFHIPIVTSGNTFDRDDWQQMHQFAQTLQPHNRAAWCKVASKEVCRKNITCQEVVHSLRKRSGNVSTLFRKVLVVTFESQVHSNSDSRTPRCFASDALWRSQVIQSTFMQFHQWNPFVGPVFTLPELISASLLSEYRTTGCFFSYQLSGHEVRQDRIPDTGNSVFPGWLYIMLILFNFFWKKYNNM